MRWRRFGKRGKEVEILPDEVLLDSSNLPEYDRDRFEGRIERPLSGRAFVAAGWGLLILLAALLVRAGDLQLLRGEVYAKQARENQLAQSPLFSDRGIITDRTGEPLAWNERLSADDDFAARVYAAYRGLSHAVGYAKAPAKDSSGFYYREEFTGMDGAEQAWSESLAGKNGLKLTETDARGNLVSQSVIDQPQPGEKLVLSLDAKVTEALFLAIAGRAQQSRFQGGAGVIMDIRTGELLALTSYPDYPQGALLSGDSQTIKALNADPSRPFLDRATGGLYAPGSIVKPMVAAAALTEGVIDEYKQILSTGALTLQNPYDPSKPSIFKDWKAHGWVDARHAIAVSSDVYFYEVGGGFKDQRGLGITKLDEYYRAFGFGEPTGIEGFTEKRGSIPTPEWKKENFPDDPDWRVGNTYHTAIGQYGMQITPLQAVRAAAAVANGGRLLTPSLLASTTSGAVSVPVTAHALEVAREGMRLSVTDGIAQAVKFGDLHVAAKTGTAQVGARNEYVNSWMIGFWPYEHPRYAYAVVLERGPAGTLQGAPAAMNVFLQWMMQHGQQYLE